mmetsp:Transcript_20798/g.37225  ORF Transcript_20798/g.37225 Transcript_20798/m.37225 type:complete len:201 (+) Transcript_20798:160-762(+)
MNIITYFIILSILFYKSFGQIPTIIIPLHDDNFEHITQAATGQTTGHWLVLFRNSQSTRAENAAFAVAENTDKQYIVAQVMAESNPKLMARFKDLHIPSFVYFRYQRMYIYNFTESSNSHSLREFAEVGWEDVQSQEVPPDGSKSFKLTKKLNPSRLMSGALISDRPSNTSIVLVLFSLVLVFFAAGRSIWIILMKNKLP